MTKRQFSILLGLACQTGCVVYDDPLRRQLSDVAIETAPEGSTSPRRDAAQEVPSRLDVAAIDVEASGDASADAGMPDEGGSPDDAPSDSEVADAPDAAVDALGDGRWLDATGDGYADVPADDGARGDPADVSDALREPPISGCTVDFTVSGVVWDFDASLGDGGARGVRLVGDIGQLGGWDPTLGLLLSEKAPGAWSGSTPLAHRLTIEFKFVKMDPGLPPEWEEWPPFDSNRSFLVDCSSDGGTFWIDAGTDGGTVHRAVGRSYGGAFGVKPLDATK
jgi:hypothetical protein